MENRTPTSPVQGVCATIITTGPKNGAGWIRTNDNHGVNVMFYRAELRPLTFSL